jgi:hypothetical protein
MKILLLIFLGSAFGNQLKESVYLSFNVISHDEFDKRKIHQANGDIHFYLGENLFVWKKASKKNTVSLQKIETLPIINIKSLEVKANEIMKNQIQKELPTGTLTILFKNDLFNKIFLLVKENESYYVYEVVWVEKIE